MCTKNSNLLRINLTNKTYHQDVIAPDILEDFIGGRGVGIKLLYEELEKNTDPLSAKNALIVVNGPLSGTSFPTTSRAVMVTKSPATNGYLYSVAGAKFGRHLARAGYRALIITGSSDYPTFVSIQDTEVKFINCEDTWGLTVTPALFQLSKKVSKDASIITIGPAGENLVSYANATTEDYRHFGRGGIGAVMGAKKLKAISVYGSNKVEPVHQNAFKSTLKNVRANLKKQPGPRQDFPKYGSGASSEILDTLGILPSYNWKYGTFEGARAITTYNMRDNLGLVKKDLGCHGCPIRCSHRQIISKGPYAGSFVDGPEYETIYALGSNLGISNPEFIIAANMECNELGLDTMSTGVVLGFAMECFEKGLYDAKGDKQILFGDEKCIRTIKDIAYNRGMGSMLAKGVKAAAKEIGPEAEKFAMQVKGLEMGGYDPRGAKGQSIVYAAGNRGGCHHSIGLTARAEINNGTRFETDNKGVMVRNSARNRIIQDSLITCTFAFPKPDFDLFAEAINNAVGAKYNQEQLKLAADRINTLERSFNLREGWSRQDDTLPKRLLTEPLPDGQAAGNVVAEEELNRMLENYYEALGWNTETGIPNRETLIKLGLEE